MSEKKPSSEASEPTYWVDDPAMQEKIQFFAQIPHAKALGLDSLQTQRNKAIGKIPYHQQLVGNLKTGAVHTGVLISLMDSIAGLSVQCALPKFEAIVTLDLRVDCYKPSTAGKDLYCHAECHRLTNTIAFVRGSVYHDSLEKPIAGCVASFFRTGKTRW